MRRIGTSGGFTQVGQELALEHLYGVNSGGGSGRFNAFAGLDCPDAGLTATSYPTLQYAVFAKYIEQGDSPSDPLDILKGSSIVAMEY